jgi:hypothetical protein
MPILTKRERQDAKLTLAGTDRRARNLIEPGRYIDVSADATQLPTRYAVGDNTNLVINPNISGLLPGRPWNSTTSVYAILAFEPKLVFDFTGNVFKTGGDVSTFGASITHAATTNATMVDSDGLLKWRPHNLVPYSEDQTQWNLYSATATRTADRITFTTATTDRRAATFRAATQTVKGLDYKIVADFTVDDGLPVIALGAWASATRFSWAAYDTTLLTSSTYTISDPISAIAVDSCVNISGNIWRLTVGYTATTTGNSAPASIVVQLGAAGQTAQQLRTAGVGTGSCGVTNVHTYQSGLGGMVNNPDASTGLESYVPTTTTPVYLSRRGHHIYNGDAWVNEGILHESEARTNLMTSSGDLTGTGWTGQATTGTVTAGSPFGTYQTISPVGSSTNLGGAQRYQIGKPITSGSTYVGWALAKYSVGSGWFVVNMYDTGKANEQAFFDLQNGVVGSKNPLIIDHGMVDYGDGWWLCWASSNAASGSGGLSLEVPNGDGVQSCTATDVILIAGSQFELGATPSSYIPTVSASATRAAETLTVPAANLPYNSTNVSIQMDGKMTYADTGVQYEVQKYRWRLVGSDNLISTNMGTAGGNKTGQPFFTQRQSTSGTDTVSGGNTDYSPDVNVPFNLAARHGSTFLNGAHEGTLLTANTTPTILPDLSATGLELGQIFMGTIGQFRMWDEDLGDVGITEATEPSTEPSLSLTFDGSENSFIVLDWSE